MMGDLFAMLNDKGLDISKSPISAKYFAEFTDLPVISDDSGLCIKSLKNNLNYIQDKDLVIKS